MRQNRQITTKGNIRYLFVLAFLSMLVFGLYHIRRVIQSGNEEYGEITRVAQTASVMMHFDDLLKLNALPEDTLKIEYTKLKRMLQQIRSLNKSARFSYIYTIRNGKVLFMVDSEPENSPDCSPPGQELTEATALDRKLMEDGSKQTIEFSKDRWGDWVSILVPLKHPVTNKTIAVFGMDFDAKVWQSIRWKDLALAILIVVLSLVAIVFIAIIISNSQKLKRDYRLLKRTEMELLMAKEKAEESDRLKTSFLKNISHEIRTPMNSILGFAGLLKEQELPLEYKELYLQNMINSGQRMLSTIYDIIDLSRVQSGQISATIVRTNMAEQLYRLLDAFSNAAKEKGLEYRCTISQEDKDLFFYTDSEMLHSVLEKLLWNALKFTSKGFIEVGYQAKGNTLEFYVMDSGVGVDEVQKSFIFEYFRQGNESMTRNHEGNGLGLTIAKAYVEILGGTIWVESNEGKGSIFRFTIPFFKHAPDLGTIS
jgi:signal transduction histidine kinase